MNQESGKPNYLRLQFISIPGLKAQDVLDENGVMNHPYVSMENISRTICEYFALKPEVAPLLFQLFKVNSEKISDHAWKIKILSMDCLSSEFLDVHYLSWIESSKQENSMDEFGQLLEVQNILRNNYQSDVYAIFRI